MFKLDKLICYGTAASGNLKNRFESFEESRTRVRNNYKKLQKNGTFKMVLQWRKR